MSWYFFTTQNSSMRRHGFDLVMCCSNNTIYLRRDNIEYREYVFSNCKQKLISRFYLIPFVCHKVSSNKQLQMALYQKLKGRDSKQYA